MDRLWALRNDYGPALHGSLLTVIRCTVYRCPYCRSIFKVTWGPSNVFLGNGERSCWKCKKIFWDNSNEWPGMTGKERYLFLVPITIAGYLGAFLILVGIDAFTSVYFKKSVNHGDLIFFIAFIVPIAGWFAFRFVQVTRSIRRYNGRGEMHA
jgi:hypothetical protein